MSDVNGTSKFHFDYPIFICFFENNLGIHPVYVGDKVAMPVFTKLYLAERWMIEKLNGEALIRPIFSPEAFAVLLRHFQQNFSHVVFNPDDTGGAESNLPINNVIDSL